MLYAKKVITLKNNRKITLGELLNGANIMSEIVLAWEDRLISTLYLERIEWLKQSWDRLDWTSEHVATAMELLHVARRMKNIRSNMQAERRVLHNAREQS